MSDQRNIFVPPTVEQRAQALGETNEVSIIKLKEKNILIFLKLNADIRRALTVAIDESFPPIPIPDEDDWLSTHYEAGQTVRQFERLKKPRLHPTLVHSFFR
jgi:hypothetical protein